MYEEKTTTGYTPVHCSVAHPDAGGPCAEPFSVEVYGLNFCEAHGEEARIGAALEEREELTDFLARYMSRDMARTPVERAIRTTLMEAPGETWLVEILERKRESVAAEAAVALEDANRRRDEREAERHTSEAGIGSAAE